MIRDARRDGAAKEQLLFKDAVLDRLAERANVAQFVSYGPGLEPDFRYSRVRGHSPNVSFADLDTAVAALLEASVGGSVNVRSYHPAQPRSHEFVYGLTSVAEAAGAVRRLAAAGLNTIANETIDVQDGGVSGVAYGRVLEFAPEDTPRAVEKAGTVALGRDLGLRLLETVYSFRPALQYALEARVEFSIHPLRRGYRNEHTIVWEMEDAGPSSLKAETRWPNHFSRMLGDKAFGLLIADALELPVPRTTVIGRKVAPFTFGIPTGTDERWIRTCPRDQVPGLYTTRRGWIDPFELLRSEDPTGHDISSVLAQEGVHAAYSGGLLTNTEGGVTVEGVIGSGEGFMQGLVPPAGLPAQIVADVRELQGRASQDLGPVRMEWVHDGSRAWVVQLHATTTPSQGVILFPGEAPAFRRFPVASGIEGLRSLIDEVRGTGDGVILVGAVGVTSHMGDLLRRARIPSRLELGISEKPKAG